MTGRCRSPRKASYGTKLAAMAAARTLRKSGLFSATPYRCPCGRWHLTTQN